MDPATEEVITMVAEADRLQANHSHVCFIGCSHNLMDVRTTIFTNNVTSGSTKFGNSEEEKIT